MLKITLEELKSQSIQDINEYKNQLEALANLYVKGYEIDWNLLHQGESCQKVSLPTYPFLKERYWIVEANANQAPKSIVALESNNSLHPLVRWNTSTLTEQSFKTQLRGIEFYLTDHVVGNQKVFPGVAYLEMARAAAELALPGSKVRDIEDVVWAKPLIVHEVGVEINLRLEPQEEKVAYTLYTLQGGEETVHGLGTLIYGERKELPAWSSPSALEEKLSHLYTKEEIYQHFSKVGLHYGQTFQAVEWIKTDNNEALGYYRLPSSVLNDDEVYELHPSLLDGTFQVSLGFMLRKENPPLSVPFALEKLILHRPLPSEGYSHIRRVVGSDMRFDIQVLDMQGQVCAELKGLSVRPIAADALQESRIGLRYYHPQLKPCPLLAEKQNLNFQSLCIISKDQSLIAHLRAQLPNSPILHLQEGPQYARLDHDIYQLRMKEPEDWHTFIKDIQQQGISLNHFILGNEFKEASKNNLHYIDTSFQEIFILIQTLMQAKAKGPLRFIVPYRYNKEVLSPSFMLTGFAKSLRQEHPQYQMQVVGFDDETVPESQFASLIAELRQGYDFHVRYIKGERQVESYAPWIDQENDSSTSSLTLRQEGTYLITGGLGGLGLIFAEYLAKNYQAKLILTGRSALTPEKQRQLHQLESLGAAVLYLQGDVSDQATVENWIEQAKSHFGDLHGIIHSAGIIEDRLLLQKEWTTFKSVLLPKVLGSINIDAATRTDHLDFFVVFSSLASCVGNVGQTDYASANAFLDQFAKWRETQVQQGHRQGKSLSINWPYWADGGMRVDSQQALKIWGMEALPTDEGMKAFIEGLISNSVSQLLVLYGKERLNLLVEEASRLRSKVISKEEMIDQLKSENQVDKIRIREALNRDLASTIAELLKLPLEIIDATEDLTHYGFDSITFY